MKRILVAVDGSEESLKAARMAADIASRFGAKLTICHVVPATLVSPDAYLFAGQLERDERATAEKILESATSSVNETGLEISTAVLHGSPAEAIADEADAKNVGMVVVGSRGRGAVKRMLLGSVSDRLVHIARCPVLVVH